MDFEESVDDISDNIDGNDLNEDFKLFENDPNSEYKTLKDVVIFLIDCNENLLRNGLEILFTTIEGFLKTKIITNDNDLFCLIMYNVETPFNIMEEKDQYNKLNFEGIHVLIKPNPPDASLIKQIKNLADNSNPKTNQDYQQFLFKKFPTSKIEISLNEALWICQTELKQYDAKDYNRRIFLFSENDNPMTNNPNDRTKTIQRAKDMLESDIILELFPMSINKPFDLKRFFCDIIPHSEEDLILTKDNCLDRIKELNKRIRQKEFKKRRLGQCPFYLTKDVKVQVNLYSSIRKAYKSKAIFLEAKNNNQLSSINNMICKDTGAILYPNQVGTYHIYGGKKVIFTKEDMKNIKNIDNYGMKLMGFKDKSSIKPYYNIRSSYFVYPDESVTEGASQLFDALIKQLTVKDKVAIVKFVSREGTIVRFCALYPQKEVFDEDLFQTPPGFNLVFMPYADEIRSTEDILKKNKIEADHVSEKQFEAAKKLIKKMNIDFDSRNFENPTLQKFYSTLQALALGENEIEKTEDSLKPNKEGIKNLSQVEDAFRELIYYGDEGKKKVPIPNKKKQTVEKKDLNKGPIKKKVGSDIESNEEEKEFLDLKLKKKKKDSKIDDNSKKRDAVMDHDEGYSDRVLMKMLETQGLDSLTVDKLKEILSKRNLKYSKSIKKADLLNHLKDYLYKTLK